jgi:3-oxoacid CoA-transferase
VVVLSRHLDKRGKGKLVEACTLPLTARGCVDTLITERALFRRMSGRMTLTGVAPGCTVQEALVGIGFDVDVAETLEDWEG